jgi:hypothetical protein
MTRARQAEFSFEEADPGERDSGLRPIAVFPNTGMRFSPIVSIRAGILRDGYGKFTQFADGLSGDVDGREIENREEASTARLPFQGDDLL